MIKTINRINHRASFHYLAGLILLILQMVVCSVLRAQTAYKAPLYWSVYEYHILKEQAGQSSNYIPESEWLANIDWVDANLKDLGYDMICIDGWGDVSQLNEHGYRKSHSSHWEHDYAWWSAHLQERGMRLGMYGNPLWINVNQNDQNRKIVGTDIPVSSLIDPNEDAKWFTWVQVDRPGAEEYVKGYVQYYADMGVKYFRVDFLSWFESGQDRYLGRVGPDRPRAYYETALRWMREAADENGMFLSLVMPNLYNEASAEKKYGHMFRINEDTGEGTWWKWSEKDRGQKRVGWSVYANPFDGLTYWSYLSDPDSVKLDPDFIRLNTFDNDEEKKSVVSLCLMSGGALTVADRYNSIGNDLWLYQNKELLSLREDGFVGHPLTNDPTKEDSQIWTGQLSNGQWVVALFNRENVAKTRAVDFSALGFSGDVQIRDLWTHENLPSASTFSESIPAYGCRILKVAAMDQTLDGPGGMFVKSLVTGTSGDDEKHGTAEVTVLDNEGNPVAGATVIVTFSASFNEKVSGVTGADGKVILETTATASGKLRVNACVKNVEHPTFIYTADLNQSACEEQTFFVGGTFNDWDLLPMKFKDGFWIRDSVEFQTGDYELKFANTDNFSGDDWGNASGLSGTAALTTGGGANIKFTIPEHAYYTISFDDIGLNYEIAKVDIKKLNDEMYVGATFTDWALVPMIFDGDNWVLTDVEIPAGVQSIKFANTSDWSGDDWGNAAGMEGTAKKSTGGDPNITFKISEDNTYTITFNDISLDYSIFIPGVLGMGMLTTPQLFPNPTSGRVNIKGEDFGVIRVFNASGQELSVPVSHYIDLSQQSDGIYYIRLEKGKEMYLQKIYKTNE